MAPRPSLLGIARQKSGFRETVFLALGLAVFWWVVADMLRRAEIFPVWFDQGFTFLQMGKFLGDPYQLPKMVYPPWTALILAPFALPPAEIAILLELLIYFAALTAIIYGYGGGRWAVLLTLLSFVAFDSVLELNLEWVVCLGLLVPRSFSGFFLLTKPQVALGAWFGFPRWAWLPTAFVTVGIILISLLIWGWWPPRMWGLIEVATLPHPFNIAPARFLGVPLSVAVGIVITFVAVRRADSLLGILGWLFFAPYISIYSLLLHFGLVMVRFRKLGVILFILTWLIYGGAILIGFFLSSRPS